MGSRDEPRAALRSLASGRLRFVLFKRGARGGILYDAREDRFVEWAPRAAARRPSRGRAQGGTI